MCVQTVWEVFVRSDHHHSGNWCPLFLLFSPLSQVLGSDPLVGVAACHNIFLNTTTGGVPKSVIYKSYTQWL